MRCSSTSNGVPERRLIHGAAVGVMSSDVGPQDLQVGQLTRRTSNSTRLLAFSALHCNSSFGECGLIHVVLTSPNQGICRLPLLCLNNLGYSTMSHCLNANFCCLARACTSILADLPLRIFAMFLNKTAETFLQIQLQLSERLC